MQAPKKAKGKTDLLEFIVNRGSKVVDQVIATAWEMEKTSYVLQQRKMTRLEILEKALKDPCKRATQVK